MKYLKRSGIYKASNVTFNPSTCQAYSYGWWRFVDKINGYVVFNAYRYSNSTSRHQYKVGQLMDQLGIKIDLTISVSCSLNVKVRYQFESVNVGLKALEDAYKAQDFEKVKLIKKVFKVKMSQEEISKAYQEEEERLCDEFLFRSVRRQEKQDRKMEKALEFMTKYAVENKLTIVEPGVGTYTIGKSNE